MAVSEYDKLHLTATQQAQLQKLTDEYNVIRAKELEAQALGNTSLAEDYKQQTIKLHEQAEQIRAGAPTGGYSGGAHGGSYVQIKQTPVATSTPKVTVTDYSDYITKMNEAKRQSALAELKNAYDKNVNAINRAQAGLGTAYQQARNQTAGASELAKRNNAEYAAAYGLNTGTGGQMELARNVTLQNNLNTINTQEAQSVADIQLQRANAETEYNNAIAKAQATGDYELAAQLYQEKVRVEETLLNLQVQQAQREYQAYRDSVADNQWQLNYALQAEKLANAGSSGGGTDTKTPTMSLADAKKLFENGTFTSEALQAFYDNGWSDEAIASMYGYDPAATRRQQELAASIPTDIRNMLMTNFPGGVITGDQRWQSWADRYGEDALIAAGFTKGSASGGNDAAATARWMAQNGSTPQNIAQFITKAIQAGAMTSAEGEALAEEILGKLGG